MNAQTTRLLLLVRSVHDAMLAAKVMRERGVPHELVPVPKEIDSNCGMALQLRGQDPSQSVAVLQKRGVHLTACWLKRERRWHALARFEGDTESEC